jgi:hypothetical protein
MLYRTFPIFWEKIRFFVKNLIFSHKKNLEFGKENIFLRNGFFGKNRIFDYTIEFFSNVIPLDAYVIFVDLRANKVRSLLQGLSSLEWVEKGLFVEVAIVPMIFVKFDLFQEFLYTFFFILTS